MEARKMKRNVLTIVVVVAVLAATLTMAGSAVAVDGNSTVGDQADGDDPAEHRSGDDHEEGTSDGQGPPTDLPDQVPDHVEKIHNKIVQFLNGDFGGNLGEVISGLTPDDGNDGDDDDGE